MNKQRFLLFSLLAATLLLLAAVAGFYLLLPSYLEQRLLPGLAARLGVEEVRGRVSRLGLSGAELRELTAGSAGSPALSIRAARLSYTIPGLLAGRLAGAEIDGLRLRLAYRDGTLTVPGVQWPQAGAEEGPGLALPVGRLEIKDGELLLESGQEPLRLPFVLSARQKDREVLAELKIYDFSLAVPRPVEVPALELEVVNAAGRFETSGRFRLRLPAGPWGSAILEAPFTAAGEIAGAYTPDGSWQFELKAGPANETERAIFRMNDTELAFLPQTILLSGQGRGREGAAEIKAVLTALEGKSGAAEARAPEAVLTGRGAVKGSPAPAAGDFALRLTGLRAEAGGTAVTGRAEWRGDVAASGEDYNLRSVLQLADSGVSFSALDLQATGIAAEVPFAWPSPAAGPQGKVTVADLVWAGTSMGPVTAALRQHGLGYRFDVVHVDRLLEDLKVMVAGTASWEEHGAAVKASLSVPSHELEGVRLARLHPAAAGLTLAGGVEASGDVTVGSGGAAGSLRATLSRGTLENLEKNWIVEGIETGVTFPALPGLRSAPGQRLSFGRAAFGDLLFGAGRFGYRLEESGALLVDESEVAWGGGHLRLQGLRLVPGQEEHDLVILCEGVRIPDLLAQLGVAGVEGQGEVSGRIPLAIRGGELRFGEGYLASTPGRGGFLKMKDPARLAAAIPESARAGQVDFAMEALRHFEYDQVRLEFGSQGEELILKMRLDGRPAEPLPFTFDRQLGSFVRLEGEGSAGIMQPIRLDLNFRLPLADMLHYGAGFQKLFEN